MRKRNVLLTVLLIQMMLNATAQNTKPVISNLQALADTVFHKLTIIFDVTDAENDNLEIFLDASFDNGFSFQLNTDSATGDIGYPIIPGINKTITWYYPDSLSFQLSTFTARITASDRQTMNIQQIVDMVDTSRLKQNLQFIEGIRHRTTNPAHLQFTRDTLLNIFALEGLETRTNDVPFGSYTGKNIIGRKPGTVNNSKTIILDGHYDSVSNSPGADDNGSSIAGMLEILRIISQMEFRNSVEFIAFDLEESGLKGSAEFVQSGILPYEKIHAVINMDMIGFYTDVPNSQTVPAGFNFAFPELYAELVANDFRGNFIISTVNYFSHPVGALFDSLAALYVPSLLVGSIEVYGNGEHIPDTRRSDHTAFWDAGYMALHLSDGAETRNPNYHGPNDTLGTINFMSNVTKATLATLLSLAQPIHADIKDVQPQPDPRSSVWEIGNSGCNISVSPNPSSGNIKINIINCSETEMLASIVSEDGKIIASQKINSKNEFQFIVKNKNASAYYIVEVKTSNRSYTKKIFVK
jgi:hypothetical protein